MARFIPAVLLCMCILAGTPSPLYENVHFSLSTLPPLCQNAYLLMYFHRVNAVSNAQVRGDMYDSGCLGQTGILKSSKISPSLGFYFLFILSVLLDMMWFLPCTVLSCI